MFITAEQLRVLRKARMVPQKLSRLGNGRWFDELTGPCEEEYARGVIIDRMLSAFPEGWKLWRVGEKFVAAPPSGEPHCSADKFLLLYTVLVHAGKLDWREGSA